jgi:hypothetical protein
MHSIGPYDRQATCRQVATPVAKCTSRACILVGAVCRPAIAFPGETVYPYHCHRQQRRTFAGGEEPHR